MCKILKNTKIKKLIIVLLVILLLINIFPDNVQAAGFLETAGGVMLDAILEFLMFLGDTVLNILQNNFISTEKIIEQAQSGEFSRIALKDVLFIVIGVLTILVSIVIAIASWGTLSWASFAGVMTGLKFIGGVVLVSSAGLVAAVIGTSNMVETLTGKFDLPLIRFTPYEIFSNQIPVFDINFISPMDSVNEEYQNINADRNVLEMLDDIEKTTRHALRRIETSIYKIPTMPIWNATRRRRTNRRGRFKI